MTSTPRQFTEGLTEGAARAVLSAVQRLEELPPTPVAHKNVNRPLVVGAALLIGILREESLGATHLSAAGISHQQLEGLLKQQINGDAVESGVSAPTVRNNTALTAITMEEHSLVETIRRRACNYARRDVRRGEATTEDLLKAVTTELPELGKKITAIYQIPSSLSQDEDHQGPPIKLEHDEQLSLQEPPADRTAATPDDKVPAGLPNTLHMSTPTQLTTAMARRVIDANLNRAREGLRVLEDFSRFGLNHNALTRELKQARHSLRHLEEQLAVRLSSDDTATALTPIHRDAEQDVGRSTWLTAESSRRVPEDLVRANCRRVEEACRSLEEFGKLLDPVFAEGCKQLRYTCYTVEQQLLIEIPRLEPPSGDSAGSTEENHHPGSPGRSRRQRRTRLAANPFYVLMTTENCRGAWQEVVRACVTAGVAAVQLRQKTADDRRIVSVGRELRRLLRDTETLFIMNDRPDLAVLCDADGVHVGQEELAPEDVRRVVGPDLLIGLSTHSLPQAVAAANDPDVDYLGVGPVFPSSTKEFSEFPGTNYVRQVANEPIIGEIPWFAVGGIGIDNVGQAIDAGASRFAISHAILQSADPLRALRKFNETHRAAVT